MNYANFNTVEGNLLIRLLITFVIGFYLVKNNSSKRGLDYGLIKQSIVYLGASVLLTFSMLSSLLLPLLFFGLSFLFSRYSNLDQQKGLKFSAVLIFLQVIF